MLFVPAWEGGEEEEDDEGEDYGHDAANMRVSIRVFGLSAGQHLHQVWEDDQVLERRANPDQIQWVLVDAHLFREQCCVVRAQVITAAVRVDADAEVAHPHRELSVADDVCNGGGDTGVDLRGGVCGCVGLVVEGYEEDAGDEW